MDAGEVVRLLFGLRVTGSAYALAPVGSAYALCMLTFGVVLVSLCRGPSQLS